MDDFIAGCVDEVALEGPGGCKLERFWALIATKWQADGPLDVERLAAGDEARPCNELDQSLRNYVWSFILKDPQLDIVFGAGADEISKHDLALKTQDEINTQFPNLHIVASEEARRYALGISTTNFISEINIKTLVLVARQRAQGITQFEMSKILNMDPRNMFHQIKVLISLKLIIKAPVTIRGSHSNLCIHKRFAHLNSHHINFRQSQAVSQSFSQETDELDENSIREQIATIMEQRQFEIAEGKKDAKAAGMGVFQAELVRYRITAMLAGTANRVMVVQDLMEILIGPRIETLERKMFNKVLNSMADKGFVDIFETQIPRPNAAGGARYERCARLLKLYKTGYKSKKFEDKATYYSSAEYQEKIKNEPENKLVIGEGLLSVDLPVEYQVYNVIRLSGAEGTTAAVIRRSLSNLAVRILERIMKRLQKPITPGADPLVMGDMEFQGRERRYRYFTTESYYVSKAPKGKDATEEPRMTSLMASALEALSPAAQPFRSNVPISARKPRPISRMNTQFGSGNSSAGARKRKAFAMPESDEDEGIVRDSEDDDVGGVGSNSDDDVLDPTVNVMAPRSLRARNKTINFVVDVLEESEHEDSSEEAEHVGCSVCNVDKDDETILLCDCCDKGRHTYCADPPLDSIPEGDWFCSPECQAKGKAPEPAPKPAAVKKSTPSSRKRIALADSDDESAFEDDNEASESEEEEEEEKDDAKASVGSGDGGGPSGSHNDDPNDPSNGGPSNGFDGGFGGGFGFGGFDSGMGGPPFQGGFLPPGFNGMDGMEGMGGMNGIGGGSMPGFQQALPVSENGLPMMPMMPFPIGCAPESAMDLSSVPESAMGAAPFVEPGLDLGGSSSGVHSEPVAASTPARDQLVSSVASTPVIGSNPILHPATPRGPLIVSNPMLHPATPRGPVIVSNPMLHPATPRGPTANQTPSALSTPVPSAPKLSIVASHQPPPMPSFSSPFMAFAGRDDIPSSPAVSTPTVASAQIAFNEVSSSAISTPARAGSEAGSASVSGTPLKVKKSRAKHPDSRKSILSSTSLRRERLIVEFLKGRPILEANMKLADKITEILQEESGGPSFKLDRKTLERTGKSMEEKGLLKTVTILIQKLNGKPIAKKLFLNASLSRTGPEVDAYKAEVSELAMNINAPKLIPHSRKEVEGSVERVQDMMQLKFPNNSYFNPANIPANPFGADGPEGVGSGPQDLTTIDPYQFWLQCAKKYGYTMAKALRVKTFHEWLFGYFVLAHTPDRPRPKGVFTTFDVYNYMSLDVFLKVIGLTVNSDEMDAYMHGGGDMGCVIKELPEPVRVACLAKTYRLKGSIQNYLDYGLALQLIDFESGDGPAAADGSISVNELLVVKQSVPLIDMRSNPHVFIKDCPMETEDNMRQFWLQMEFIYRKLLLAPTPVVEPVEDPVSEHPAPASAKKKRKRSTARHHIQPDASPTTAKILMLLQPRNWRASFLFSAEEGQVLESYIDRNLGIFPTDDNSKISRISEQLGIAATNVKYYFYRAQQNYERRLLITHDKHMREAAKRRAQQADDGVPIEDTEGAVVLQKARRKVQEILKRRIPPSDRVPELEPENMTVYARSDQLAEGPSSLKRRVRTTWAQEGEALLMHVYAIVRSLSTTKQCRFSWNPIMRVLNTERELCRRRMVILMKTKLNEEKVDFLVAAWPNFLANAVKEGKLQEIVTNDLQTVDLLEHARYFFANSSSLAGNLRTAREPLVPKSIDFIPLPADLETVEKEFYMYPFQGGAERPTELRIMIDNVFTVRAKMTVLYSQSFLADIDNTNLVDASGDGRQPSSVALCKLMACVKSVLVTPDIKYDGNLAFRLLYDFSSTTMNEGLERLNEQGSIVKNKQKKLKAYRERTVPGRTLALSEKFLATITGALPIGLIPQVLDSLTDVLEGGETLRPLPDLYNGTVCLVLESLAHDMVKLTPNFAPGVPDESFEVLISNNFVRPKPEGTEKEAYLPFDEFEGDIDAEINFAISLLDTSSDEAAVIHRVIAESGVNGISLLGIKAKVVEINSGLSDREITCAVASLLKAHVEGFDAPIVSKVGQGTPLYISAKFLKFWRVRALAEAGNPVSSSFTTKSFSLRVWYDVNGELIPSVFRACLECVMSHIVERPGVAEATLAALLSPVMNYVEFSDILDILLERGACRKVCLLKPKPFSGLRDVMRRKARATLCDEWLIDENKVSTYFPQPEWCTASNVQI
ncbi:hypothetical protein HDU98_006924 [Podochytrium sp. JEL0797]|nr:hypothetical protein HDU98_006924 [Podochytrium sp. JEL0797]